MCKEICSLLLSRPSRGAWIEMVDLNRVQSVLAVAPLAGRVD